MAPPSSARAPASPGGISSGMGFGITTVIRRGARPYEGIKRAPRVQAQPRVGHGGHRVAEPGQFTGERLARCPMTLQEALSTGTSFGPADVEGSWLRRTPISSAWPTAPQRVRQPVHLGGGHLDGHGRSVAAGGVPGRRRPQAPQRGRPPPDRVSTVSTGRVHRRWTTSVLPTLPGVQRDAAAAERGSTLPFVLVCWTVAALMAFGAIAASDAFLEQQAVQSVCDGAALAAANRTDEAAVYSSGVGTQLPLTRATAQAAVADQLADGGAQLDAWSAETDGAEVTVRCTRYVTSRSAGSSSAGSRSSAPRRGRAGTDGSPTRRRPPTGKVGGRRTEAWRVKDSNLRRLSRRIYSPLPLATRATRRAVVPEKSTRTVDGVPGREARPPSERDEPWQTPPSTS